MVASVAATGAAVLKLVSVRPTLQLRVRSLSGNFHLVKPEELKPLDVAQESRRYYFICSVIYPSYTMFSDACLGNTNFMTQL